VGDPNAKQCTFYFFDYLSVLFGVWGLCGAFSFVTHLCDNGGLNSTLTLKNLGPF